LERFGDWGNAVGICRRRIGLMVAVCFIITPVAIMGAPGRAAHAVAEATVRTDVAGNGHIQTSAEAEQTRIEQTAAAAGISIAEATTLVNGQDAFGRSLFEARSKLADNFSAAEWGKDSGPVVHMTKGTSAEAMAVAKELFRDQQVSFIADAEFSKRSGQEIIAELTDFILNARPDLQLLKVGRDPDNPNGIEISTSEDVSEVVSKWGSSRKREDPQLTVTQTVTPGAQASSTINVVGGAQLNSAVNQSACTSGFPVYSNIGGVQVSGILSADHCPDSLLYGNYSVLTFRAGTVSKSFGDMQWHSTTQNVPSLFQSSFGVLTNVRYAGEPFPGLWLSRYGRNSQERIQVDSVDNCETYTNNTPVTYCRLADTVYPSNVVSGDSGGPWFDGETVYAIQSGRLYWPGGLFSRASMSPIWDIVDCLPGVTLKRAL